MCVGEVGYRRRAVGAADTDHVGRTPVAGMWIQCTADGVAPAQALIECLGPSLCAQAVADGICVLTPGKQVYQCAVAYPVFGCPLVKIGQAVLAAANVNPTGGEEGSEQEKDNRKKEFEEDRN